MRTLVFILAIFPFMLSAQVSVSPILKDIEIKEDTVLSVYTWITENIEYDVRELRSLKNKKNKTITGMSQKEFDDQILADVVKSKKAVCQGYSMLYSRLLTELGYESYVVKGYSKLNNQVNSGLGHAWVAVKQDGTWQLHDPTWGAGQVKDGRVFIHAPTMQWYDVDPQEMILTHMPYDPIWQLLETPYRYVDFDKSNAEGKAPSLDYNAEIANHLTLSTVEKRQAEFTRSKSLGRGITLIEEWQKRLVANNEVGNLNSIGTTMEEVVGVFNEYIKAKNNRFSGKLWTMEYALDELQKIKLRSQDCLLNLKRLGGKDRKVKKTVNDFSKKINELTGRIDQEIKFLESRI